MKTTVEKLYIESIEKAMTAIQLPASQSQINGASNRAYTKVNQIILVAAQAANKFESNIWYSKDQLDESKLTIKAESKGTMVYTSSIKETGEVTIKKDTEEVIKHKAKSYRYYHVFNKDQLQEKSA